MVRRVPQVLQEGAGRRLERLLVRELRLDTDIDDESGCSLRDVFLYTQFSASRALDQGSSKAVSWCKFVPFRDIALPRPDLTLSSVNATQDGIFVSVTAKENAPFVWLSSGSIEGRFSENGFFLRRGESRRVEFLCWSPISLAKLQKELSVRSIRDTY